MRLCLATFDLHLPGCQSLKEKRRIVKGLIESLRSRMNVSVAEVDYLEKWQRAAVAVAWISAVSAGADGYFAEIDRFIAGRPGVESIGVERVEY